MNSKEILAKNIRYYINQRGITRPKLADDLNVPYSTVVNWTTEQAYPRIKKLDQLARYFNVSKSDLTESHGNTPEHANNSSPDEIDLDDAFAHHKEFTYHNKKVSPETIKYIKRMLGGGN